jgi:hypothetical protein
MLGQRSVISGIPSLSWSYLNWGSALFSVCVMRFLAKSSHMSPIPLLLTSDWLLLVVNGQLSRVHTPICFLNTSLFTLSVS